MRKVLDGCYWCFYCEKTDVPLLQLGKEATEDPDDMLPGEEYVSPEDANAVEICQECLIKAIGVLVA